MPPVPERACAVQWPDNVWALTDYEGWEVVYQKLLENEVSYDKICSIWPIFIRLPVREVEFYIKIASTRIIILIDSFLAGAPSACMRSAAI